MCFLSFRLHCCLKCCQQEIKVSRFMIDFLSQRTPCFCISLVPINNIYSKTPAWLLYIMARPKKCDPVTFPYHTCPDNCSVRCFLVCLGTPFSESWFENGSAAFLGTRVTRLLAVVINGWIIPDQPQQGMMPCRHLRSVNDNRAR